MPTSTLMMPDAQSLEAVRDQRLNQAKLWSSQGISLLSLAELDDYQNREIVLQACHLLMDAIQIKRDFVEPYLHLARAFIVFNDDQQALKYLLEARHYDPENQDIQRLLEFLQSTSSPKASQTAQLQETDLNQIFSQSMNAQDLEALEEAILRDIRNLLASEHTQIQASPDPQIQAALRQTQHSLQVQFQAIQDRLNDLSQYTEISGLQLSLRPLEILLRRFNATLQLSERLAELQQEILRQKAIVTTALTQDQGSSDTASEARLEADLESVLDHCDQLADQLDELASANQDISSLEGVYQELVDVILLWQDRLDEGLK